MTQEAAEARFTIPLPRLDTHSAHLLRRTRATTIWVGLSGDTPMLGWWFSDAATFGSLMLLTVTITLATVTNPNKLSG